MDTRHASRLALWGTIYMMGSAMLPIPFIVDFFSFPMGLKFYTLCFFLKLGIRVDIHASFVYWFMGIANPATGEHMPLFAACLMYALVLATVWANAWIVSRNIWKHMPALYEAVRIEGGKLDAR